MLGEAAKTHADAERYRRAYRDAIGAIGRSAGRSRTDRGPGISVKLSALHPRYEPLQAAALRAGADRHADRSRACGEGRRISASPSMRRRPTGWRSASTSSPPCWPTRGLPAGTGSASPCRPTRSARSPLIDWVAALAGGRGHRIPTRLVKGAYWDSEIKLAQVQGHADYPVFTRKAATDVSWLACARRMLECRDAIYPAFATHNAHSLAFVLECAGDADDSRCSACTAWARRCTTIVGVCRCGSMRRSARTRTCSPIWCAGCWRTAPTPASCIAWSIRRCPRIRWCHGQMAMI